MTMEKDRNGLTKEQRKMVRRAFREIDSNGNGLISATELGRAARLLGYNPTSKEVQRMIKSVDKDKNGQIDFKEFAQLMRDQFGALEYQEMNIKDAFCQLDKDGNGYIDYSEFRSAMQTMGDNPLTDEEFQIIIQTIDVNQDGRIDYEELSRKMCLMDHTEEA